MNFGISVTTYLIVVRMIVSVKVKPGSRKQGVSIEGDMVVIRLRAPAVDGKANDALIRYLSDILDIPRSQVLIVGGERARLKRLEIPKEAADRLKLLTG